MNRLPIHSKLTKVRDTEGVKEAKSLLSKLLKVKDTSYIKDGKRVSDSAGPEDLEPLTVAEKAIVNERYDYLIEKGITKDIAEVMVAKEFWDFISSKDHQLYENYVVIFWEAV